MKSIFKKYPPAAGPILFVAFIGLILMLLWPALTARAGTDLPERPPVGADLPKRPPVEKPDQADKDDNDEAVALTGAYIQLQVHPHLPGLWTVVEWQDSAGVWQVVEGWQGTLEGASQKTWWVSPADFTTGPFRWAVYQRPGGLLLATSRAFHLPAEPGQTAQIVILLTE